MLFCRFYEHTTGDMWWNVAYTNFIILHYYLFGTHCMKNTHCEILKRSQTLLPSICLTFFYIIAIMIYVLYMHIYIHIYIYSCAYMIGGFGDFFSYTNRTHKIFQARDLQTVWPYRKWCVGTRPCHNDVHILINLVPSCSSCKGPDITTTIWRKNM